MFKFLIGFLGIKIAPQKTGAIYLRSECSKIPGIDISQFSNEFFLGLSADAYEISSEMSGSMGNLSGEYTSQLDLYVQWISSIVANEQYISTTFDPFVAPPYFREKVRELLAASS